MLLLASLERIFFSLFSFFASSCQPYDNRAFWGSCGLRPRQTHLVLPFVPSSSFDSDRLRLDGTASQAVSSIS